MPLHVKLIVDAHGAARCSKCERFDETFAITVFAEGGSDITEPVCVRCLSAGVSLSATIEPVDLSPGRHPPGRRVRKRTDKEERELAQLSGGRRQKGSGSLPHLKGDFYKKGVYRGESKTCFSKSPSWTLDDLTKIRSEAAYGEAPVLVTTFMDRATHQVRERWATIPFETWLEKFSTGQDRTETR